MKFCLWTFICHDKCYCNSHANMGWWHLLCHECFTHPWCWQCCGWGNERKEGYEWNPFMGWKYTLFLAFKTFMSVWKTQVNKHIVYWIWNTLGLFRFSLLFIMRSYREENSPNCKSWKPDPDHVVMEGDGLRFENEGRRWGEAENLVRELSHTKNKITLFWLLTLITFSYSSQNEIWGFEMNSGHVSILERALSYFILEPKVISLIITWLVPGFQLYSFSLWKGGKI